MCSVHSQSLPGLAFVEIVGKRLGQSESSYGLALICFFRGIFGNLQYAARAPFDIVELVQPVARVQEGLARKASAKGVIQCQPRQEDAGGVARGGHGRSGMPVDECDVEAMCDQSLGQAATRQASPQNDDVPASRRW